MLQRMVDDMDEPQDDGDLDKEGDKAFPCAVALFFEQFFLFFHDEGVVARVKAADVV